MQTWLFLFPSRIVRIGCTNCWRLLSLNLACCLPEELATLLCCVSPHLSLPPSMIEQFPRGHSASTQPPFPPSPRDDFRKDSGMPGHHLLLLLLLEKDSRVDSVAGMQTRILKKKSRFFMYFRHLGRTDFFFSSGDLGEDTRRKSGSPFRNYVWKSGESQRWRAKSFLFFE